MHEAREAADAPMRGLPRSYREAIAGAVARLDPNSRAARQAIYDRARQLLMEESRLADPPWELLDVVREQRALEAAIESVEEEFSLAEPGVRRPRERFEPPSETYPEFEDEDESESAAPQRAPPRALPRAGVPVRVTAGQPPAVAERAPPREARSWPIQPRWIWAGIAVGLVIVLASLVVVLAVDRFRGSDVSPPQPTKQAPPARQTEAERKQLAQEIMQRGDDKARGRDFDGAIVAYDEAIRLDPGNAAFFNNRAFAFWSKGETDRAIADYDQALARDPDNIVALVNRAVAYNFRGDYDLAVRDLDRAVKIEPNNPGVWNSRCWGRALAGRLQEAIADCDESLRLRPNDPNTLDSRGFAHLKYGLLDRAIADYDAALRLNPNLAASLYGRGIAKIRKGDRTGGNADVAAAKQMRPEIDTIFLRYGLR